MFSEIMIYLKCIIFLAVIYLLQCEAGKISKNKVSTQLVSKGTKLISLRAAPIQIKRRKSFTARPKTLRKDNRHRHSTLVKTKPRFHSNRKFKELTLNELITPPFRYLVPPFINSVHYQTSYRNESKPFIINVVDPEEPSDTKYSQNLFDSYKEEPKMENFRDFFDDPRSMKQGRRGKLLWVDLFEEIKNATKFRTTTESISIVNKTEDISEINTENYETTEYFEFTTIAPIIEFFSAEEDNSNKLIYEPSQVSTSAPTEVPNVSQEPSTTEKSDEESKESLMTADFSDIRNMLYDAYSDYDYSTYKPEPEVSSKRPEKRKKTFKNDGLVCKDKLGYVADISSGCKVFYICIEKGVGESMSCPNGTLFNQDYLVCDWWYNVNCGSDQFNSNY